MTRLALLLPVILFLSYHAESARRSFGWAGPVLYIAVLLALVLIGRFLAMRVARDVTELDLHTSSNRLARIMDIARMAVLLWPGAGLYILGWGDVVDRTLAPLPFPSALAGGLIATLPAYLAWLALYWAQYPADRAVREAAMLQYIESALPVRAPPTLKEYLDNQLRMGLGIPLLTVVGVLLTRDISTAIFRALHWTPNDWAQSFIYLGGAVLVFLFAPIGLVRVLHTHRLPDGELRQRLEALSRRSGVRYHDVLVWRTGSTTGNAMVTGFLPRFRYVLLSDVLLESMPDDAIEAVFAHELGHIVHRHMAWYGGFLIAVPSLMLGWLTPLFGYLGNHLPKLLSGDARSMATDVSAEIVALAALLAGFGVISRRFERQADVYAARAMQARAPVPVTPQAAPPALPPVTAPTLVTPAVAGPSPSALSLATPPLATPVGPFGAHLFASALRRVAWLNNIPVAARNWTHGSIASRLSAVETMAIDAEATRRFDTAMRRLRVGLVILIVAGVATAIWAGV